ncbi:MAG TPA: hypothetical protein VK469_09025 [Candidatus Kapabacteria bacterium]|nr:hypothetical protein [Candidatus Kapabacteria bacterium]
MKNTELTPKKIINFWYPLAASWLMMSIEGPFLAAIIARLPEPKYNLAAYGVAFSFAMLVESPIIMLLSATTALCKNSDTFYKLRRFTFILNSAITSIMLIVLLPPVFHQLAEHLIELPHDIAQLTHIALLLLLPWPAAIGFRRFYQGILIRRGLTRRVAYGTMVRLISMATAAGILHFLKAPGAYVGAASLAFGVTCEAIATRLMVRKALKELLQISPLPFSPGMADEKPITYRFIARFYYPLALMNILSMGVYPMVTFFMGKSRNSIESLAVLPVINSLLFIFRSFGLSYTEVVIAQLGENKNHYIPLRNFALFMAAAVSGGLTLVAFTPLGEIWFHQVSGLSLELAAYTYLPIRLLVFLPALTVWINFQRAILVTVNNTLPISLATFVEVGTVTGVLYAAINRLDFIGVVAAACAYVISLVCSNSFLLPFHFRNVGKINALVQRLQDD